LHQLVKQGFELGEESGMLGPEINGLESGGDDVGIGGSGFEEWDRGKSVTGEGSDERR
jgi:hypothetical protein